MQEIKFKMSKGESVVVGTFEYDHNASLGEQRVLVKKAHSRQQMVVGSRRCFGVGSQCGCQ